MSDPESSDLPRDKQGDSLEAFLAPLALDIDTLHSLAYQFAKTYKHLALTSDEQFLPTPVTRLPSGQETGRYLAIDVGGTNLRVAFIDLLGEAADSDSSADGPERSRATIRNAQRQRFRRTLEKAWPIGEHLKKDKAEDLFAWIGDCIAEVVADSLSSDTARGQVPEELEMGITFSFPMMQDSLNSATLMPMGKGFAITSDLNLGSNVLAGYERHTKRPVNGTSPPSSKRRKLFALPRLKIAAITNDTVATLCSCAYLVKSLPNSRVAMGIIVGTGCNATIPMRLSELGAVKREHITSRVPTATETVVNTEWTISGACGPLESITTSWDRTLDQHCARPGFQPLEYMTGGRYVGELVRIIFHDWMTNHKHVSADQLPANLVHSYSFTTSFMSTTVARARSDTALADELTRTLPPPESSDWTWDVDSAQSLRHIASLVQTRSAGLIAAATVGLLACTKEIQLKPTEEALASNARDGLSPAPNWNSGPEELVVAYTGGIIQQYPHFKETCQRYIDRLVMRGGPQDSGKSVFLREASDGGIIGAGVLAGTVASGKEKA